MNKRRVLSLILAILMVMTLLPTTALAASKGKTANVQASVKIGGKTVKVALSKVPAGTKLKLTEPKKSDYKKAVDAAVSGKYDVVLAVKAGVSPSLKKEVKATITASAINGKKAEDLKLFRVSNGKAKEIKIGSVSGKELTFNAKSFGILVLVKVAPPAPTPTAAPQPTEPPVDPTEPPVDPTEPPVDPTDPPVDPTDPPVDPTDPPIDPTDPPVDPTDPPIDPTDPPVDPTDPPVDPTDPPVDPTDPPVDPTDPPVDPTDPPVDPTEPPVDPTEPPAPAPIEETLGEVAVVVAGAPEGTTLTLAAANAEADAAALDLVLTDGYKTKFALDIAMTPDEFEEAVTVSVSAPALAELSAEGLTLYHIKNGEAEEVAFTLADGVLTFASKSFSPFELVQANAPTDPPTTTEEPVGADPEPTRAAVTRELKVNLTNLLAASMWTGEEDIYGNTQQTYPASVNVSFTLADGESIRSAGTEDSIRALSEAQINAAERSLYVYNTYLGTSDTTVVYDIKNDGGVLKYRTAADSETWTEFPADAELTFKFYPYYMLVKFDPNTADQSVAEGYGLDFQGTVTVGTRSFTGEIFLRFKCTGAGKTKPLTQGKYTLDDGIDWPSASNTGTSFLRWTARDAQNDGGDSFGTSAIVQNSGLKINSANYSGKSRKPVITAMYSLPSTISTRVKAKYPDATLPNTGPNGYPLIEGEAQGVVTASKTAQWVDIDAAIAKIILSVKGTPLMKGSDVVFVLDGSGSMGGRYTLQYAERETFTKIAAVRAAQILFENDAYNNRIALVDFHNNDANTKRLMHFQTWDQRNTAIGQLADWTVQHGNTPTNSAMVRAFNTLEDRPNAEKSARKGIIIFLTDGSPVPSSGNDNQTPTQTTLDNIRNAGYEMYTIGISLSSAQQNNMKSWAIPNNSYSYNVTDASQLVSLFESIAKKIVNAGEEAVFADDLSVNFDSWTDPKGLAEYLNPGTTYTAETGAAYLAENYPNVVYNGRSDVTITTSGEAHEENDDISISVGSITKEEKVYEIYMNVDEEHYSPISIESQKCNDDVSLTYKDPNGNTVVIPEDQIGKPYLGRDNKLVEINYYRVNEAGQYIAEDGTVLAESQKSAARISIFMVEGVYLETTSSEEYEVNCDLNPDDPSVHVINHTHKIWGDMPDGYVLWSGDTSPKTETITTDYSVSHYVEFLLVAPYTIVKARNDDAAHQDSSNDYNCTGYAIDELVPYSLTVTNTSVNDFVNVYVKDTAVVPKAGTDTPATGEIAFVSATINGTATSDITYDATEHKFLIPSFPGNAVVVINYTYKVMGVDIGKRIDNWATVMGIKSNTVQTPTRLLVEKIWANDHVSYRPQGGVTINLLKNGTATGQSITIGATADAAGKFIGGFMVDDSSATYSVAEAQVPQYYSVSYGGTVESGLLTVTNTLPPFYVYHSSDGSVDVVSISEVKTDGTYDLVETVKANHRYGGYYNGIGNLTAANFTDGVLNDGLTALTYDGSKLYYEGVKAFWKNPVTQATGQIGTAVQPVPGAYYFLKEVPEAYLTSRIQFVYDWAQNYKLQKMFLHTVVDDKLYSEIGFEITTSDRRVAKIVSSFKFTPANGGTPIVTKPTDFSGVSRGFVGYIDYTDDLAGSDGFLKANVQFKVQPYWITPDGVTVYGTARTFNTGDGTKNSSGIHEVT